MPGGFPGGFPGMGGMGGMGGMPGGMPGGMGGECTHSHNIVASKLEGVSVKVDIGSVVTTKLHWKASQNQIYSNFLK